MKYKNDYIDLLSTQNIIKSLKISTMLNMQIYSRNLQGLKERLEFVYTSIMKLKINIDNKPIKRVFFAIKELFSSNFAAFNIGDADYVIGYLPNTNAHIIDHKNTRNVYTILEELHQKYTIEYYVLHAQANTAIQIDIELKNNINFEIYELDYNKLTELYYHLYIEYAYAIGNMNLNLYKISRMDNAIDNLETNLKYTKKQINKSYQGKLNKLNSLVEGVDSSS